MVHLYQGFLQRQLPTRHEADQSELYKASLAIQDDRKESEPPSTAPVGNYRLVRR